MVVWDRGYNTMCLPKMLPNILCDLCWMFVCFTTILSPLSHPTRPHFFIIDRTIFWLAEIISLPQATKNVVPSSPSHQRYLLADGFAILLGNNHPSMHTYPTQQPTIFPPPSTPYLPLAHINNFLLTIYQIYILKFQLKIPKMGPDPKEATSIYEFSAKDIDGKDVSFDKYKGKVLMVVNVASQCGLTDSNYNQLKEVLDKYKPKGLEIAAFPCNQFGGQEPGCEIDIKEFVNQKYNFEPDLYSKVNVNGNEAHPIYQYLKKEKGGFVLDAIKWNFTKFLVDRSGKPFERYSPTTEPKKIEGDIEKLLAAQS